MRMARMALVVLGAAAVAYGCLLAWPEAARMVPWLVAGPVLHDAVLAPVVAAAGLLVARSLPAPARWWVRAGLVMTATLLLLAVPLVLRPGATVAPEPGLSHLALTRLAWWLAVLWAVVSVAARWSASRPRVRAARAEDHQAERRRQ
ncbi:hypothetical protein [Plantactinospora sp. GCM10030261]|uniref:hypothetical protein n=1 Tax=Plantactinospora sp. GCM10030261 TaxID=3273420 RepID=UPI00360DA4E8